MERGQICLLRDKAGTNTTGDRGQVYLMRFSRTNLTAHIVSLGNGNYRTLVVNKVVHFHHQDRIFPLAGVVESEETLQIREKANEQGQFPPGHGWMAMSFEEAVIACLPVQGLTVK